MFGRGDSSVECGTQLGSASTEPDVPSESWVSIITGSLVSFGKG